MASEPVTAWLWSARPCPGNKGDTLICLVDRTVAIVPGSGCPGLITSEVGRRIAAALNACRDLTTSELESGIVDRWRRQVEILD